MIRIIDDTHFELFRYYLFRKGNFPGTFVFGLPPGLRGSAERRPHDKRRYSSWEGVPACDGRGLIRDKDGRLIFA